MELPRGSVLCWGAKTLEISDSITYTQTSWRNCVHARHSRLVRGWMSNGKVINYKVNVYTFHSQTDTQAPQYLKSEWFCSAAKWLPLCVGSILRRFGCRCYQCACSHLFRLPHRSAIERWIYNIVCEKTEPPRASHIYYEVHRRQPSDNYITCDEYGSIGQDARFPPLFQRTNIDCYFTV